MQLSRRLVLAVETSMEVTLCPVPAGPYESQISYCETRAQLEHVIPNHPTSGQIGGPSTEVYSYIYGCCTAVT
jgi:hypothetical protein